MLSPQQQVFVEHPLSESLFLEGMAGCGKTTVGVERMLYLMAQGVRGDSILILVPQRTLAAPYQLALQNPGVLSGGLVSILTVGGLAQRMVDLYWPLVSEAAGFTHPERPPIFLTLETALYQMARLVRPLLDEGFFDSLVIDRNRLYSQILDNLNKAALVGFPHIEIRERLSQAFSGDGSHVAGQLRLYADAQECALRFRQYCLDHNLLDFSLQMEVFLKYLWPHALCRDYLQRTYRHLVYDNIEEDTPAAHDLVGEWLPSLDSALLIYDWDAGYRRFLGADPDGVLSLRDGCTAHAVLVQSFVTSPAMQALQRALGRILAPVDSQASVTQPAPLYPPDVLYPAMPASRPEPPAQAVSADYHLALSYEQRRFFPQMLDRAAEKIAQLVQEESIPAGQIVVLAPFLSDALRYALTERLGRAGIEVRSYRPSRALREEPAAQCLLTLAALANPHWGFTPSRFDVVYAFMQAIGGLDLVRGQLLVEAVYRTPGGIPQLAPFDHLRPRVAERITFRIGLQYERLRQWLEDNRSIGTDLPLTPGGGSGVRNVKEEPLDYFLSRLFGEVLSQPGFGFHASYTAGETAANLIESAAKFRRAAGLSLDEDGLSLGREYLLMVRDGVIAAQYLQSWQAQPPDAVWLAPAYTFLMSNRSVDVQFWLEVGNRSWGERLFQPLTHPYVLSRSWPPGRRWSEADEVAASQLLLYRLVLGLLRRCRSRIYLMLSELNEQGYEERGPLLRALAKL